MTHKEVSVTSIFNQHLRAEAARLAIAFEPFPLDSQDRTFLSDSLLARLDYFCLVEMKFSQSQLRSERHKRERVLRLCRALEKNAEMRALHDQCHLIAWMDSGSNRLQTSPYRHRICNHGVFGACDLVQTTPIAANTIGLNAFASQFFGQPPAMCVSKTEFTQYADWLTKTVSEDGTSKAIHVLARSSDFDGETIGLAIESIDALNAWLHGVQCDISSPRKPGGQH